jgi:hypothetical protein
VTGDEDVDQVADEVDQAASASPATTTGDPTIES